ncbi:LysR family transcriptional regulator [Thioclava sp. FR2]|uniref:LysR family transcriptional regulator n=1 Tax=Thioclava sp. FR2 TaxID=3445780 RepID=UPI003EC026C1
MIRLDTITLKQLRTLQAVAAHGSLTAAASEVGLTIPAIHSQIKNLESAVGTLVLIRSADAGRMQLTSEGTELLRAANRIEGILSQAGAQIQARFQGRVGHVSLSVVSTAKYFAPRLVRNLNDRCPEIEISLRVGNREAVISDLDQGRCELAIMGRPPREPQVEATPLGPHPHGVVLPPDHPLAQGDGYDPSLLVRETFLSREPGSGTRTLMQRFLERFEEGHSTRVIEMDSNETIKQAVLAGLGLAFLSLHTVHDELAQKRLAVLRGPYLPVMRHWYLVAPVQLAQGPAAQRIAREIVDLNGIYLPKLAIA